MHRQTPPTRSRQRGNALIEYGVPLTVLLVVTGALATSEQIRVLLADYFVAASGHTRASLSGSTFTPQQVGQPSGGQELGNGWQAFSAYAQLRNGQNQSLGQSGDGIFFAQPVLRAGARAASPDPEYLYPR